MNAYDENQAQQAAYRSDDNAREEAMELVHEWCAENPERLDYAYDDTTAFADWKREGVKRLLANPLEASAVVLGQWATEAEHDNA